MSFSKFSTLVFGILFIVILYVIIFFALKIMNKDVKGGGRRRPQTRKKSYGIEVIGTYPESGISQGSVIPVKTEVTIGRKEDNSIVLNDRHVSANHGKLLIKNEVLFIEDLNSTNGTYLNGNKLKGRAKLSNQDEIRIGSGVFKILT